MTTIIIKNRKLTFLLTRGVYSLLRARVSPTNDKKKPIYILCCTCVCVCVYKTPLLCTAATHYEKIGRVHTKLYNSVIL